MVTVVFGGVVVVLPRPCHVVEMLALVVGGTVRWVVVVVVTGAVVVGRLMTASGEKVFVGA